MHSWVSELVIILLITRPLNTNWQSLVMLQELYTNQMWNHNLPQKLDLSLVCMYEYDLSTCSTVLFIGWQKLMNSNTVSKRTCCCLILIMTCVSLRSLVNCFLNLIYDWLLTVNIAQWNYMFQLQVSESGRQFQVATGKTCLCKIILLLD